MAKTTHFIWLSITYASIFPIIPSLFHAANPRTIVVKCDGSVYDVDVDKNSRKHSTRSLGFILALDQTKIYKIGMLRIPLNQNENSKLVKHHNDNTSPGLGRGAHTREVTQSSNSSVEEMRESGRSFQSLVFWVNLFLKASLLAESF